MLKPSISNPDPKRSQKTAKAAGWWKFADVVRKVFDRVHDVFPRLLNAFNPKESDKIEECAWVVIVRDVLLHLSSKLDSSSFSRVPAGVVASERFLELGNEFVMAGPACRFEISRRRRW